MVDDRVPKRFLDLDASMDPMATFDRSWGQHVVFAPRPEKTVERRA